MDARLRVGAKLTLVRRAVHGDRYGRSAERETVRTISQIEPRELRGRTAYSVRFKESVKRDEFGNRRPTLFTLFVTRHPDRETMSLHGPNKTSYRVIVIDDQPVGPLDEHEPNAWRGGYRRRGGDPWQAERDEQKRAAQRKAEEKSIAYDSTRESLLAGLVPIEFHELNVNLNDLEHEAGPTDYSLTTGEATRFLRIYPGVGVTETSGYSHKIWVDPAFLETLARA